MIRLGRLKTHKPGAIEIDLFGLTDIYPAIVLNL